MSKEFVEQIMTAEPEIITHSVNSSGRSVWIPAFAGMTALFVGMLINGLMIVPVHAADTATTAKSKLSTVESRMDEKKQHAAELEAKASEANAAIQDLRQKLISATASLQAKAEEQDRLEDKLDELSQEVDAKNATLKASREKLNLLTEAMIELGREPPEADFLQNDLTTDHIHRAILLRSIVPKLSAQTELVAQELADLNDLQTQLAEQKHLAIAAQENLEGQQHDLDQLIKTRQGLLQRTEAEKESINRQLTELSDEAKDLRQLLEKVTPKPKANPRGHPQPSGGGSFTLKAPVAGNLIHGYGVRDADGVMAEGLTYAALPGSPVVAPQAGKIVFAGPFRGYGRIVILQHEGGYHSFLAGFARIDAEMGQEVTAGEPLGVLPAKTGTRPELYFEWRHNNEPVDPMPGLK